MHQHTRSSRRPCAALVALLALFALPAVASVESELAFHRGVVAFGEEKLDEAQRQFEIVLAADAEDDVAIHYLGMIAEKRGDHDAAIALFDRAIALDPDNLDLRTDRALSLLAAGRVPEAREELARVLEAEPDRANAQLFAGIAAYRAGAYRDALPHLDRAGELDPDLRANSRYYAGLSEAFLGDLASASSAFDDVAGSPIAPLAQSAQNLRRQVETRRDDRPWEASFTAGMEYDSNPTVVGDVVSEEADWRGVLRPHGSYQVLDRNDASLTLGYDGYWGFQVDQSFLNLQTHSPWISGGYDVGPVRLGLRYDYSFTFIDTVDPFRHLHRVTPSASVREGDWGITYAFYQFYYEDYLNSFMPGQKRFLDRDGDRDVVGANQFFFPALPYFSYARIGALGEWARTDGTEWSYDGYELSGGTGFAFPFEVSLTVLYRFISRDYLNDSFFFPMKEREDRRHVVTVELAKQITRHWSVSAGGAFTVSGSNIPLYNYDRYVGGAYVTYTF